LIGRKVVTHPIALLKSRIHNSNPDILEGLHNISAFLGKSPGTVLSWIKMYNLPVVKLPSGVWFTHKALVLQWIVAGHVTQQAARKALEDDSLDAVREKLGLKVSDMDVDQVVEQR
jgi:hypothetical protein